MTHRVRQLLLKKGYRHFRDTTLDFTHPENGRALNRICLIGRNGTGKSTVLRVLAGQVHSQSWQQGGVNIEELQLEFSAGPQSSTPADAALVHWRAEAPNNEAMGIHDVPEVTLDQALGETFAYKNAISDATVSQMWRKLIYLVNKRENDRQKYETRPENLDKTKAQLIAEFDSSNPPVLKRLAELWNAILAPAGLELDVENATIPVQLTENLHAYVRHKETKQRVPYEALSTGIRNFLFKVGHLFLIYFNRRIDPGFVLIDEPENSLFPDFLFELVSTIDEIVGENTQLFVATHSPIVAAQFEPHERVILDFDDEFFVTARRGRAPKGDDPNDVLEQDFGLPDVMGPAGRQAWARYVELIREIRRASDSRKQQLVDEAADLGRRYGFSGA